MAEARPMVLDPEKGVPEATSNRLSSSDDADSNNNHTALNSYLLDVKRNLISNSLETRGIRRVEPEERYAHGTVGFIQAMKLWFSMNLAANNITLGMLGPVVFSLSFKDAAICASLGALVGSLCSAYIGTLGPKSGLRSLVIARFSMGWWPSKIIVILNIILNLGYSMIDTVIAGQILSAVSPNYSLTIIAGIIITSVLTWIITTFGVRWLHIYEGRVWIPHIVVFSILAGVAGPYFDLTSPTIGNTPTRIGNRLSFFGITLSAAITYSGGAADFFVYYPENTSRLGMYYATAVGLGTSFAYALIIGVGLGSGVSTNKLWSNAYDRSQGALIVQALKPLGTFGNFCSVIIAIGQVANCIPGTYVSGNNFQILGRYAARIPRVIWNTFGVVVYTICAAAGRNNLAEIFENFLPLMGYWCAIWLAIMAEEHFIFKRSSGFDWTAYNDKKRLPIGLAALVAFLVGWAGAVLSMAQYWYVGPLAALVGDYGGDMGNYVGASLAAVVYPPLRYLEYKKIGR